MVISSKDHLLIKVKSASLLTSEWANNIGNCNFWVPIYNC